VIGFYALLPKFAFLLVGLVLTVGLFTEWKPILLNRSRPTPKLLGISAFMLLWIGLLAQLFIREISLHYRLSNLRPDAVASIEVNNHLLTNRDEITAITNVLNHPQWFSVNHGGWADEVPIFIKFKTGDVREYQIALYLRQEGAILEGNSNSDLHCSHWAGGDVFYQRLPSVLARAGVTLPNCQSLSDGRFCTACERPCPARLP
jgi:hypothetical protein